MKNLLQVLRSILIGLASVGLIFGGLSLSLAEGNMSITLTPTSTRTYTSTQPPTYTPTLQPFVTKADTSTPLPPTQTPTLPPPPTNCPPPAGWLAYKVQSGDTLDNLAARYRTSSTALKQANCLLTDELLPGVFIYVPPIPTQTRIPCGPPRSWIASIIQHGDTLYRLSQAYGIAVSELQNANCMGSSTLLRVGQIFYVPPWATRTPSPTFPGISTPIFVPTDTLNDSTLTPTSSPPAFAPTATPTSTPTETPTIAPSDTPTDTEVPSPTSTDSPTPSG